MQSHASSHPRIRTLLTPFTALALITSAVSHSATVVTGTGQSPNQPLAMQTDADEQSSSASLLLQPLTPATFPDEYRTIDGTANIPLVPDWGSASRTMLRIAPPDYADGRDSPSGSPPAKRPSSWRSSWSPPRPPDSAGGSRSRSPHRSSPSNSGTTCAVVADG